MPLPQPADDSALHEMIALAVAIEIAALMADGSAKLAQRLRDNAGYELADDSPFAQAENKRRALLRAIADQLDALA